MSEDNKEQPISEEEAAEMEKAIQASLITPPVAEGKSDRKKTPLIQKPPSMEEQLTAYLLESLRQTSSTNAGQKPTEEPEEKKINMNSGNASSSGSYSNSSNWTSNNSFIADDKTLVEKFIKELSTSLKTNNNLDPFQFTDLSHLTSLDEQSLKKLSDAFRDARKQLSDSMGKEYRAFQRSTDEVTLNQSLSKLKNIYLIQEKLFFFEKIVEKLPPQIKNDIFENNIKEFKKLFENIMLICRKTDEEAAKKFDEALSKQQSMPSPQDKKQASSRASAGDPILKALDDFSLEALPTALKNVLAGIFDSITVRLQTPPTNDNDFPSIFREIAQAQKTLDILENKIDGIAERIKQRCLAIMARYSGLSQGWVIVFKQMHPELVEKFELSITTEQSNPEKEDDNEEEDNDEVDNDLIALKNLSIRLASEEGFAENQQQSQEDPISISPTFGFFPPAPSSANNSSTFTATQETESTNTKPTGDLGDESDEEIDPNDETLQVALTMSMTPNEE